MLHRRKGSDKSVLLHRLVSEPLLLKNVGKGHKLKSREQGLNFEGNRGTKTILRKREHTFVYFGEI